MESPAQLTTGDMHISDVNPSTHHSDHLKNSEIAGAEPIAPGREAAEENREVESDRVEISEEARSAARSAEELSFARKALRNVPELSDARTAEITDRIKSGYYSRPDVIESIAERLGNELAGGPS